MKKQGRLIVISGFSGAGKGTMIKKLLETKEYELSVSATTRQKREGEIEGKDYFFLTKAAFQNMIEADAFIEWTEYVGHYYGTPKAYVLQQLSKGKNVILEIEVEGAKRVKEKFPDAVFIFITPPSIEELKKRLLCRGTETQAVVQQRILQAAKEVEEMEHYDFLLVNDQLENAVRSFQMFLGQSQIESHVDYTLIKKIKSELEKEKKQ